MCCKLNITAVFITAIYICSSTCSSLCDGKRYMSFETLAYNSLKRNLTYFQQKFFAEAPLEISLENNGYTIIMEWIFKNNAKPTITYGPFGDAKYQLEFMYFSWFNESLAAQLKYEDWYPGNITYVPVEMHMVLTHINFKGDYHKAKETNYGVAVLSFKHVIEWTRHVSNSLLNTLVNLTKPNDKTILKTSYSIYDMGYYLSPLFHFYVGKSVFRQRREELCGPDVIWIDFAAPVLVSPDNVILTKYIFSAFL
ncbi:uncharacterized protein isoform X2 [Musca autumnalis]|uniref:uncharacterized protein isoform X2 n=1 Tax=Musca autumnalis TaxID=221902 RepID=UPI003CEC1F59